MGGTAECTSIRSMVARVPSAECNVRRIGLVLFNGFALPAAASIIEVFQAANALIRSGKNGHPTYDVYLISASGGSIASSSSVFVWTESVDSCRQGDFHALFVVGGDGAIAASRDERLITWLCRVCTRSDVVFPIEEGRLLLEAAGLPHTTNAWPNKSPADSTRYVLAAAPNASASLQTAVTVLTGDLGDQIARQISAWVAPPPPTHFSKIIRKNASVFVSEKIRESARWIEANGERAISIDEAAQIAAMSERNFLRRFKAEIGVTPSEYLLYVRLDMCSRLLVETVLPIDKIARRCGVGSGGHLSKLFRKHLAITPTDYRLQNRPTEK